MADLGIDLQPPRLTREQIDQFKKDGFARVPGAFPESTVRHLQGAAGRPAARQSRLAVLEGRFDGRHLVG